MQVKEIVEKLNLKVEVAADLEAEVTGGYSSDLLSHVMGRGKKGDLWLTIQGHLNILAVASLLNFSGIIITSGVQPGPNTLKKATEEKINILTTSESTYQIAGKLYELGIGKE